MNLEKIRESINSLDQEIVSLLSTRMELALQTRSFKKGIRDKTREGQVLEQIQKYSRVGKLLSCEFLENLYNSIFEESRRIQTLNRPLIGFQGEHGAHGEQAARLYDRDGITIPCTTFANVFDGVAKGILDKGIVPVENSLGGAITQVNELLIHSDLKVVGAVAHKINHCLLILPETSYHELKIVYSHPQALSQCRDYINRHKLESRPFYDTAGAARMLAKDKPAMAGVIAGKLCSDLYDLEIIKENIQDHRNNTTRFLILARRERSEPGNRCSIIFTTPHEVGSLFGVLQIFADEGINLTRIESIPDRNDPGSSIFFLDFQIENRVILIQEILERIKPKTTTLKYLGNYKEEVTE